MINFISICFIFQLKLLPELSIQDKGKSNGNDCIVIDSDEDGGDKTNESKKENGQVGEKPEMKEENDVKNGQINGEKEPEKDSENAKEETSEEKPSTTARNTPPLLESMEKSPDSPAPTQNPTWAFIDTPEHLDALIACLNSRGFRESVLKAALQELRPLLKQSLKDCPSEILSLPEDGGEEKARIQVSREK